APKKGQWSLPPQEVPLACPSKPSPVDLRQVIQVTSSARTLLGGNRRSLPRHIHQIEKLGHIHLGGVTLGKRRQVEASLNELENCGVVCERVRDVVLFGQRRDHDQRHTVAGISEIASWTSALSANIPGLQIRRRNVVRAHRRLRGNVIIETAEF